MLYNTFGNYFAVLIIFNYRVYWIPDYGAFSVLK